VIIAVTLRDLNINNQIESINNPFKKNSWLWFVRRSFSKERSSLRLLFRRLSNLRSQKSKLMASINLSKERLFPEINWIFSIKHRASSESILLNNFSRDEILTMTKEEFIEKYRSLASKWQSNSRVLSKVESFYDRIVERGAKKSCSDLDNIMWKNADYYILEEIKFKLKHYELTIKEMKIIVQKISSLLNILKRNWYYIPSFKWINDIEIWLILWELW
jgi:nicotinamide mononucleotide adenylyltransferase